MKIFAQYGNLGFVIDDVKSGNFLCRDIAAVPDWSLEQVLRQNFYNHAKALLVVLFPIFNYSGCLFNQSLDRNCFCKFAEDITIYCIYRNGGQWVAVDVQWSPYFTIVLTRYNQALGT